MRENVKNALWGIAAIGAGTLATVKCSYDVGKYADMINGAKWYEVGNSVTLNDAYNKEKTNHTQFHYAEYIDRVLEKNGVHDIKELGKMQNAVLPDIDGDGKVGGTDITE